MFSEVKSPHCSLHSILIMDANIDLKVLVVEVVEVVEVLDGEIEVDKCPAD